MGKLKGEYQQKQLEEQCMQRQFQLQKERCEMEQKYAADMQQLQSQTIPFNPQFAQQFAASQASTYNAGDATSGTQQGSYVPPVTMPGQTGSYVPPAMPGQTGSYVPPVTMPGQTGSYAAPVTTLGGQQGSYVPPPSMGSYTNMGPPCTEGNGSYVPPVTTCVTQPQAPSYQQGGGMHLPATQMSNVPSTYTSAPTLPVMPYNQ